jgi:hypothetical protein
MVVDMTVRMIVVVRRRGSRGRLRMGADDGVRVHVRMAVPSMSVPQRLPPGQRRAAEEGEEEKRREPPHAAAPSAVPCEAVVVRSSHA